MKAKFEKNYVFPECKEEMPFGPGSEAGVIVDVNSGWRTLKPIINQAQCSKCYLCWLYCPEGVFNKEKGDLTIDYDYCKGCGICAHECPRKAITMVKEGDNHE